MQQTQPRYVVGSIGPIDADHMALRSTISDANLRSEPLLPKDILTIHSGLRLKDYTTEGVADGMSRFWACVDELTQHFDLQDRTISHFQGLGWTVDWSVDTKDIDMTASKESQMLLIRLPGPKPSGETVDAVFGVVRLFEQQHPDVKHVKASMVIPAVTDYPADAIAAARERGLEVLQDTGHGFQSVEQP